MPQQVIFKLKSRTINCENSILDTHLASAKDFIPTRQSDHWLKWLYLVISKQYENTKGLCIGKTFMRNIFDIWYGSIFQSLGVASFNPTSSGISILVKLIIFHIKLYDISIMIFLVFLFMALFSPIL